MKRDMCKVIEDPAERWVSPDECYNLRGTCRGCKRVTWLCRRTRKCSKYATTPKRGYVAMPTGYQLRSGDTLRGVVGNSGGDA
jgi:hypothetical protein